MKIVYTFFIKLPLIALVAHASRLRSLAAPARARAPGSGCVSQSRPGISIEASRRDRRCESVPFPLASRFPFRMMRATEDRRRIWAPSPRYTAEFKQKAVELYKKSGTTYAEVARGLDCDAGACPTGSRRPTRPIADGRRPVPDGRGPAWAQARERAAEEGEVQVHFPQRRQAAGLGDVRRARGDPPGPLRTEGPAAERARDARRGARRIDHPGQKRSARHIRRTRGVLRAEAHGRTHVDEARGAHHARARMARRRARAPSAPRARSAQPGGDRSKTWSSASSAPTTPTWRGSPTAPA